MFPAPPEASDLALCGVRGAWSLPGWRPPISPSADGLYRDELASPNPSPEIRNVTLFGNGVVHAAEEASCTQQLPGSGQRPPGSLPPSGPVCLLARHLGAAPLCLPHGVVFFALKPQLLRLWETSVGKLWGNFRPPDPNAMEAFGRYSGRFSPGGALRLHACRLLRLLPRAVPDIAALGGREVQFLWSR